MVFLHVHYLFIVFRIVRVFFIIFHMFPLVFFILYYFLIVFHYFPYVLIVQWVKLFLLLSDHWAKPVRKEDLVHYRQAIKDPQTLGGGGTGGGALWKEKK